MYKVTGMDVYGKRFKIETDNRFYALNINLFNGSVWERVNGRWKLIKRVWN